MNRFLVFSRRNQGKTVLLRQRSRDFVKNTIRHFHVSHNAPYSQIFSPKFCITFVFHFSWVLQPSQKKMKAILMQNFWGQIRCIMEMWQWRINYFTAQVKPGLCPKLKLGKGGPCVQACFGDGDCKGAKKCCFNGCGRVCTKPLGMYFNYQHPLYEIRRCTVVIRIRNLLAC